MRGHGAGVGDRGIRGEDIATFFGLVLGSVDESDLKKDFSRTDADKIYRLCFEMQEEMHCLSREVSCMRFRRVRGKLRQRESATALRALGLRRKGQTYPFTRTQLSTHEVVFLLTKVGSQPTSDPSP